MTTLCIYRSYFVLFLEWVPKNLTKYKDFVMKKPCVFLKVATEFLVVCITQTSMLLRNTGCAAERWDKGA